MKRRNGRTYRKFKGSMGRVYWVEMKPDEVAEAHLYQLVILVTPFVMIAAFAWAAGMLA